MITVISFLSFYPQFSCFANGAVLPEYLRQANARFGDFGEDADEARRLYAAHKLTLYSTSMLPPDVTPAPAAVAAAGRGALQEVSSRKVGEVSVTYSETSSSDASVSTGLADLKKTTFGLQLLSLIRMYGFAQYIP